MDKFSVEDLTPYNDSFMEITDPGPLQGIPKRRNVQRGAQLELVLEVVHDGWAEQGGRANIEGSFIERQDNIKLGSITGAAALISGVIVTGTSSHGISGSIETTESCTPLKLEIWFPNSEPEAYCIEWLCNLPHDMVWPGMIDEDTEIREKRELRWDGGEFALTHSQRSKSGSRASMHFSIDGVDIIVAVTSKNKEKELRLGYMICRGVPEEALREKFRETLSFVLGRPILSLGYTTYTADWLPVYSKSISPNSNDGRYFNLHTLPPYPITKRGTRNLLVEEAVQNTVGAILANYDDLDFLYLSWAYWHAMCAPYHIEAAHFGALIENLQDKANEAILGKDGRCIIDRLKWRPIRNKLIAMLESEKIAEEASKLLINNIQNANRLPQRDVLRKLCAALGAPIGDLEFDAWKQRNDAAHGNVSKDHKNILLNSKALRILSHRLVAGISKCAVDYIDYYSLGFPVRLLAQPPCRRSDHPTKSNPVAT